MAHGVASVIHVMAFVFHIPSKAEENEFGTSGRFRLQQA